MQKNFLPPLLLVLILALVLVSIVAIAYLYITAKNRERLALIEKGMNPNLASSNFWPQVGIIVGGFFGGLVVADSFPPSKYGPLLGFFLGYLFIGIGLVSYHMSNRKSRQYNSK